MEIWKDIEGYDPKYQVSSQGRVRIKENTTFRFNMGKLRPYTQKEKIVKQSDNGCGYLKVGLTDTHGNRKNAYVHRLVAIEFLSNPNQLPQVNHIDGDTYNNSLDNLEWVDRRDNMLHAIDVLNFMPNTDGINDPRPVQQLDRHSKQVIAEYSSISDAQKDTGVRHISSVCRGCRKSAGGFLWRYKESS
ncbi:NUMOD4 domain-containing protein [Macrococcus capreoli]|uniref:NUMOD4 domain-containing protein n=1 Tax=Macrococcus capreoli TaxID=2982690 RepID=UPI003983D6E0